MSKLLVVGVALGALFAFPAFALEIENQDGKDYTVTVTSGDNFNMVKIGAGKKLKGLCAEACSVNVDANDAEEVAVIYSERAVIKDGHLKLIRAN